MADDTVVTKEGNNDATSSTKKSRTSNVSRATAEGEALLKEMGFDDKETTGKRRTRAALRGDVYTPPPKKEKKASTPGTGKRGRPKKNVEEKKEEPKTNDVEEKKEETKNDSDKATDEDNTE